MRIFTFLCFLLGVLQASLQDEVRTKVIKVNPAADEVVFQAQGLQVGESGWVKIQVKNFAAIIKGLTITAVKGDQVTAKYHVFEVLKQKYLPDFTSIPKVGDEVVFHNLNGRAFLVTPTLETYEAIKDAHQEVKFLSPDLLTGYLLAYGGHDPTKKFFHQACDTYAVGLLYIVNENALDVLDCQSFAILQSEKMDTSSIKETKFPFYSRIDEIKTGTFANLFGSKKSKYYFPYFTNLVHPERDYQTMMVAVRKEMEAKEKIKQEEEKKKRAQEEWQEKEEKERKKQEERLKKEQREGPKSRDAAS
ncbi:plasminogen-binding protein [Helicobacter mustelae]|uniref:plasminogen-binding N-terminal domain-containing protein n=1 Tax=Helicobacter mustelae TaxID=217 RepID=UPI000DF96407|nr:plasminogen-binding N-terminal domain-containing protein [Helicobacter mustelae]STP12185.1 plasminogen-binding protein [Helicobacter mustelae]